MVVRMIVWTCAVSSWDAAIQYRKGTGTETTHWRVGTDRKSTRLNSSDSHISYCFFFFNDTATTEIYTLSLHDALPILNVTDPGWTWSRGTPHVTAWLT